MKNQRPKGDFIVLCWQTFADYEYQGTERRPPLSSGAREYPRRKIPARPFLGIFNYVKLPWVINNAGWYLRYLAPRRHHEPRYSLLNIVLCRRKQIKLIRQSRALKICTLSYQFKSTQWLVLTLALSNFQFLPFHWNNNHV